MPAESDDTDQKQKPHLFQPGKSGNPAGRPKGSRTKLGEAFIAAMYDDFQEHGVEVIEAVRTEKPDQYLKVVASILPKEIEAGEKLSDTLTDILERIDGRTRMIAGRQDDGATIQ